jgi:capsular exopolysaccharide synthesis family protein
MGRIFEALQRSSVKVEHAVPLPSAPVADTDLLGSVDFDNIDLNHARPLTVPVNPEFRLVMLASQRNLGAEKIRTLTARLRQIQDQRLIKKLLITSTVKDEGKTVLSCNVALSLAKVRQRVLLIDGDCHQANASRALGANGSSGLTEWWRSDGPMQKYLMRVNDLPLWFLPSGGSLEQPLEMLQSGRLSEQIDKMSSCFDWIIIDSPPSALLADASVWSNLADGILLVSRAGKTPKRLLRKVLESVDHDKLLGIVLNDCADPDQRHYARYYNLPGAN